MTPLLLRRRDFRPHKAIVDPSFESRNVLTREPWAFVNLYLKREKKESALFYWEQAKTFYDASHGLPLESAPLLLYYAFMNAAKALLTAKGIPFDPHHGVREWKTGAASRDWLRKAGVKVLSKGVMPALSVYLGDTELFFNMPFIHRTYCLTYHGQADMFVPLRECAFVRDSVTNQAYFSAQLSRDNLPASVIKRLPTTLVADRSAGPSNIRSQSMVQLSGKRSVTASDVLALKGLHQRLRADLYYINGRETLWYAKLVTKGPSRLSRQNPGLILAAMHRLSELCRYHPMDFSKYLSGQANWLLHEFIGMSANQYVDEIASELTGHQFLVPNVRAAT